MFEDDKDEFLYNWQIKNFTFSGFKTGEAIQSAPFVVDILDDTKWIVSVYPRGKEDDEYIDVFLTRCSDDGGGAQIPIIFTVALKAADSSLQERRTSLKSIFERNTTWGFHQYIRRSALLEDMKSTFLPDDVLTVVLTLERPPSDVDIITEYIAETMAETVQAEVQWTIKNWREINDFREVHKDAQITGDHEVKFRMSICESEDSDKHLILKLKLSEVKKTYPRNTYVSCRVAVLDAEDFEAVVRLTHHRFSQVSDVTSQKLFDRAEIKDSYLQDNTLRLRCVLSMETGKKSTEMTERVYEEEKDEHEDLEAYINEELIKDYERMFLDGEFCDVKVRAGSKMVKCHTSILYARSQVLSDLLDRAEVSSEDADVCVIDVDDLDGVTLEQMIYFLYSDKINNLKPPSALKLFVAGHRYQINYLKEQCSLYLREVFDFENVYDILIASHICEDGGLKRCAITYIDKHFARICLTSEWANFRKTEKELAAYTCREIQRMNCC